MSFLLVLITSIVIASFVGHGTHWALHRRWSGPAYKGHMEHHLSLYPPSDITSKTYRSPLWYHNGLFLYTPVFIVLLAAVWACVTILGAPVWITVTFGLSMLTFGLANNWAHDSFHSERSLLMRFDWYNKMREFHHVHHRNMRCNYGVVTPIWDHVFNTARKNSRRVPNATRSHVP